MNSNPSITISSTQGFAYFWQGPNDRRSVRFYYHCLGSVLVMFILYSSMVSAAFAADKTPGLLAVQSSSHTIEGNKAIKSLKIIDHKKKNPANDEDNSEENDDQDEDEDDEDDEDEKDTDTDSKSSTNKDDKNTSESNKGSQSIKKNEHKNAETANDTDDSDDSDDEDGEPAEPGQLSGFTNTKIVATQSWLSGGKGSTGEVSANMYALANLQITSGLKLGTELYFETEGNGQYFAFESPSLFLQTLSLSYAGELGGIGVGKIDHFSEHNLVNFIWSRQITAFTPFTESDLELSETIGMRTWLNVGHFMGGEHTLYGGVFFRDTTLNRSIFTQGSVALDNTSNLLGYTGKLNNWVLTLHGEGVPFFPDLEYSVGVASQTPRAADANKELSFFGGLYHDFELGDNLEISPFLEGLYRDGADGDNKTALSTLVGASFDFEPWYVTASYSYRHTVDYDNDNQVTNDHDVELLAIYYFSSGTSVNVGYQFLKEEDTTEHSVNFAINIPFEFLTNLYGGNTEHQKKASRKNITRKAFH